MGKIYCVMGKSSSGKDTVYKKLKEQYKEFRLIVPYTTRPIREGEKDGVEYYFVDPEQFRAMKEDKADGKRHMQQIWHHILNGLCTVLQQDTKIRPGAFNEQFTVEKFADVLFSLMLSALLRQDYDPAAVLEIVRRTLY